MGIPLREEQVQTTIQTELILQAVQLILLQEGLVQTTIQAELIHNNKALQQTQTLEHEQTQALKAAETTTTHHHQEVMNIQAQVVIAEVIQAEAHQVEVEVHLAEEEDLQEAEEGN